MVSGSHIRQHSKKSADLEMLREGGPLFLVSLEVQLLLNSSLWQLHCPGLSSVNPPTPAKLQQEATLHSPLWKDRAWLSLSRMRLARTAEAERDIPNC